jgi:hypothetical protein
MIVNETLLKPKDEMPLEAMWLYNGPLYLYASPKMNNLIIGAKGTDYESKKEGTFYSLKNVSVIPSKIPEELFRVPADFHKLKTQ